MKNPVSSIRAWARNRPMAAMVWAVAAMALVSVVVTIVWYVVNPWREYDVAPLGLVVELPSPLKAVPSADADRAVVYELQTAHVAVVVAGFSAPANATLAGPQVIERAMGYLASKMDVGSLRYEVTQVQHRGASGWRVSGAFLREKAPGRVVGLFIPAGRTRISQVMCLFSETRGAEATRRILNSARFPATTGV